MHWKVVQILAPVIYYLAISKIEENLKIRLSFQFWNFTDCPRPYYETIFLCTAISFSTDKTDIVVFRLTYRDRYPPNYNFISLLIYLF